MAGMPNARKKTKKYVSLWVDEKAYEDLVNEAARREMTLTDVVKERLEKHALKKKAKS